MAREKTVEEVSFDNNDKLFLFIDTSKEGIKNEEYDLAMNFFGVPKNTKIIKLPMPKIHPQMTLKGLNVMAASLIKDIEITIKGMHTLPCNTCILMDPADMDIWISISMELRYEYYRPNIGISIVPQLNNAPCLLSNNHLTGLTLVTKTKHEDGSFCMYREIVRIN